jgi:hypothetical protein
MENMSAARPFVKVIHILGNDMCFVFLLQGHQCLMTSIGPGLQQLSAPLVVKIKHQLRVAPESLGGGYFHYVVSFPQTIGVPEGL